MSKYDPTSIEPKWRQVWEETGLYRTAEEPGKENFYCLVMFPYTSGDLHAGHWYNFGPGDSYARYQRMLGHNVLHPIGFDAFGLPAENAAIKRRMPPAKWTNQGIERMTGQLKAIGAMYDWSKKVDTSKPEYYHWTQWLFLRLYQRGLAYRAKGWQNWCPQDQTVLANEQVVGENNVCERCGTPVIKKELEQWFFKITDYAERLLQDLDKVQWPERVKTMQANWIGKSEGALISFEVESEKSKVKSKIEVFTTRPDTLFGATYMVLAPEHPLVGQLTVESRKSKVESYKAKAARETELDRLEKTEKTGVFTGAYAVNPVNGEQIPVWISDYVLMGYGTGAIMAVPAHDERDYEFAQKFDLPIERVIEGGDLPYAGDGKLTGSGKFNGLLGSAAKHAIVEHLYQQGQAQGKTQYRLRDWLISRQRYWGAPIPIIYCVKCGVQPVPEDELPVELPLDVEFKPTGRSPLEDRPDFYQTKCPKCGAAAKRETDTMDTFVDSSWYFLRYPNPDYAQGPFDPEAVKRWLPVNQYIGGVEHAILHLLYSRFITKVLCDEKLVSFDEPFTKLFNLGMILGPDGQKMSKSRGNVVNPDDWVSKYGADTFRMYLMFMGPYDQGGPFDTKGIAGIYRYLARVWELVQQLTTVEASRPTPASGTSGAVVTALDRTIHKAIKAVGDNIQSFKFNLGISSLMSCLNELQTLRSKHGFEPREAWQGTIRSYVLLLAPFAPHLAEELWQKLGGEGSVHVQNWPQYDPELIKSDLIEVAIQVSGKLRGTITVPVEITEAELTKLAAGQDGVARHVQGKTVVKTIVVPRKLVNFVVK